MSITAYVTAEDINVASTIDLDGKEMLATLGDAEKCVAAKLEDLFKSVTDSISVVLESESQLTIEVTGSVSLKAEGGAKLLFFNVGGSTAAAGAMKVVLETKLQPKSR
jgi:hypothetical protein